MGNLLFANFLNRAALIVITISAILAVLTVLKPLPEAVTLPQEGAIELRTSRSAKAGGVAVVILTIVLYIVFA